MTWTGRRLRDARARKSWTQARLAEELGAALRSVASWEREESKPQAHWVAKLDDLFADIAPPEAHLDPLLSEADDLELLAEVARRMAGRRSRGAGAPPLPSGQHTIYTQDMPSAELSREHQDRRGDAGAQ